MNRAEFIRELDNNLRDMDLDERKEAIRYYEEIFDGAEENGEDIEKLTAKLGSPFEAAEDIKKGTGMLVARNNGYNGNNGYARNNGGNRKNTKTVTEVNMPAVIVAIFASPFIIAIVCTVWAIMISVVAAMGAVLLSVTLTSLALAIMGFVNLFTATATGFAFFGLGIIGCAVSLLIFKPLIVAIKFCAVGCCTGTVSVFKAVFTKKVIVGEGV